MKFRYYEQYIVEGGKCIGIGEPIEENMKDFLKTKKSKGNTRLINLMRLAYNSIPSVMGGLPDEPEKLYMYFNRSYKEMPNKEVAKNVAISNLTKTYGPLGRNDFTKDENGVYVCNSFAFDVEWFIKQAKKIQRLYQAFKHYNGTTITERRLKKTKRYKEIEKKLYSIAAKEISNFVEKAFSDEPPTPKEIARNDAIGSKKDIDIEDFKEAFTDDEITYYKKESEKLKESPIDQKKVHSHKDDESLQNFLDALNDCMDNVRISISAYAIDGKTELRTNEYVPLNIFGAFALHIFDMYKKGMSMVTCEVCGVEKEMKKGSAPICNTCQNNRRQRKYSIKNSMKLGLSLDEIIEKHSRIPTSEVKKIYDEIINENK